MDNHDQETAGTEMSPVEEQDDNLAPVRNTDELPTPVSSSEALNSLKALDSLGDEVVKTQAEQEAANQPEEQQLTFPSGEYFQTPRNPEDGFGDFEVVSIVQKIHTPEMMERSTPYPPVMLVEDPKMGEDHNGACWRASMIFDFPVDGVAAVYFWATTPEEASSNLLSSEKVRRFLAEQKIRVEEWNRDER